MDIKKAQEILTLSLTTRPSIKDPDYDDALTIALICMSFCDAAIKARGQAELAELIKGD